MNMKFLGAPSDHIISVIDKRINGKILAEVTSACYEVCETKGATMPSERTPQNLSSCIESIPSGSSASYFIRVYEFSGITVELYDSTDAMIDSKTSIGGLNEFSVSNTGTYTIKVKNGSTLIWSKSVVISDKGVYIVKGRTKSKAEGGSEAQRTISLSLSELDAVCKAGYVQNMFYIDDIYVPITTGTFKDMMFYIQEFINETDGSTSIKFTGLSFFGTSAVMNYPTYICKSSTATSFTTIYTSQGGYKYTTGRIRLLPKDIDIWTLASGLKPDGSVISQNNGFEFSQLRYSNYAKDDPNGKAGIYTYNAETDTFTEITTYQVPTVNNPLFIHGYFSSVGKLTEEQFNSGTYYTYVSGKGYDSLATTWNANTTYDGFYPTTKSDGLFWTAISSIKQYLKEMQVKCQAGVYEKNTQTSRYIASNICNDKLTIPSINEDIYVDNPSIYIWSRDGNYTYNPTSYGHTADKYSIFKIENNTKYISGVTSNGQNGIKWKFQFVFN